MKEFILEILRKIELEKRYEKLCLDYDNSEERKYLKRKEVEKYIQSHDSEFKYVAREKLFLKEFLYKEYTVRLFIYFKRGMISLAYLIWKEGGCNNNCRGSLANLTELINPEFVENVRYKWPIATSIEDFKVILAELFLLLEEFTQRFVEGVEEM